MWGPTQNFWPDRFSRFDHYKQTVYIDYRYPVRSQKVYKNQKTNQKNQKKPSKLRLVFSLGSVLFVPPSLKSLMDHTKLYRTICTGPALRTIQNGSVPFCTGPALRTRQNCTVPFVPARPEGPDKIVPYRIILVPWDAPVIVMCDIFLVLILHSAVWI